MIYQGNNCLNHYTMLNQFLNMIIPENVVMKTFQIEIIGKNLLQLSKKILPNVLDRCNTTNDFPSLVFVKFELSKKCAEFIFISNKKYLA